jgi:hypothetical protein
MSEFFGRLETELRAAAERPPRRAVPVPAITAAVLLALAVAPIVFVLGSGSDEAGAPDRRSGVETPQRLPLEVGMPDPPDDAEVVATGTAPVAGPWEILTWRSVRVEDRKSGRLVLPARLRCLGLRLLDPPSYHSGDLTGQCGESPLTPGFSLTQLQVPIIAPGQGEVLVYGRAPEEAALVRLTPDAGAPVEMEPIEGRAGEGDVYLFAVPRDIGSGRVNWIDDEGNEGSVGQELGPP